MITSQHFFVYNDGILERGDLLQPLTPQMISNILGDIRRSNVQGNVDYDTCAISQGTYTPNNVDLNFI